MTERRSNFHKRGPKIKPGESSKPANEQVVSESPSNVNGDPTRDSRRVQNDQLEKVGRNKDHNDATMEEESSGGEAEGTHHMGGESTSGEDDENEEEDNENEEDENSHHASIPSRPTASPPSDGVMDGRSKQDDESSDSTED